MSSDVIPANQTRPLEKALGVAVVLGLAAQFLYRISPATIDADIWHGMALAREAIKNGYVPMRDQFAYTPTVDPSIHHEWGAGMVAYFIGHALGPAGIIALKFTLAFGMALMCWTVARRDGARIAVLSFLTPIAILLADNGFSTVRAQMYSFLFSAVILYWIQRDREGDRRWIVVWLPLLVFWQNVHAGFLVGVGFLAMHGLEQLVRRGAYRHLLALGLVMFMMVSINPYGLRYYPYLWAATRMPRPRVIEWGPLWETSLSHQIPFAISFALLVYGLSQREIKRTFGVPIVVVSAIAAVQHQRFLPFYAIAWLCHVPSYLSGTPLGRQFEQLWSRRTVALLCIWTLAAVAMTSLAIENEPWRLIVPGYRIDRLPHHVVYPVGVIDYLAEIDFHGNLMVSFDEGGYVAWKLHPQVKISMDGRYEAAYPAALVEENYQFYMAHDGWRDVLDKYPTDAVLAHRSFPVAAKIADVEGWESVYDDGQFVVYSRPHLGLPKTRINDRVFAGSFP